MEPSNLQPLATSSSSGTNFLRLEFRLERRFSLSIVLSWLVIAAIAFGICSMLRTPPQVPVLLLFWGIGVVAAQMCFKKYPRIASSLAGSIIVFFWTVACQYNDRYFTDWPLVHEGEFLWVLGLGAIGGYIAGTLVTCPGLIIHAAGKLSGKPQPERSVAEIKTTVSTDDSSAASVTLINRRRQAETDSL